DKKGRITVLFGSIFLYSCANIANAFVTDLNSYSVCRLLAGIGLGGEFGVGVTLVSELMPKEKRGYGTMLVAVTGVFGAMTSSLIGDWFDWKTTYIIGGLLGFALLGLRIGVHESGIFTQVKESKVTRGSLRMILRSPKLLKKYLSCVGIGAPIWIVIGLFMTVAPELGRTMGISEPISAGKSILFFNIGFGTGEILSASFSQWVRSRRKSILVFLTLTAVFSTVFLNLHSVSASAFYAFCTLQGLGCGYWAVFMMVAAEQFGTNLRATVTTSAPNLVRGLVVPGSLILGLLQDKLGLIPSLGGIFICVLFCAYLSWFSLEESFGRDLSFVET
ncbi:MAG: MFS transporter, partial [Candidatus Melainabacteria bacterium]|nr:MFS transporter [Candidatus Melainabacteria bacterium]